MRKPPSAQPAPSAHATGAATAPATGGAARSTPERLLDAAERLFADRGIEGTSLRALTRTAGVNLAAAHYHFGSKEGLLDAVVGRHAEALNHERLQALQAIGAPSAAPHAPAAPPRTEPDRRAAAAERVEAILRAYLEPAARLGRHASVLARLFAREQERPAPASRALLERHFGAIDRRFVAALAAQLPQLDPAEVRDRFQLALGCVHRAFAGRGGPDAAAAGVEARLHELMRFCAAGIAAPSARCPRTRSEDAA